MLKEMRILKYLLICLFAVAAFVEVDGQNTIKIGKPVALFTKGDNNIAEFRIPSMITTEKGTVIAVCDARVDRGGDVPNNIDLVMRKLGKGSKTWTPLKRIVNFAGKHGAADPCLLQDRQTGRIFLFYAFCPGRNNVTEGPNRERRHLMVQYVYSDDEGESWSNPIHVDYALREDNWQSIWSAPGRGVQLKDGKLVVPCTINKDTKVMATILVYSDDHGKTWDKIEVAENINEPQMVELSNGDWMINARNQMEYRYCRAITISNDGGNSWSKPKGDLNLPDPNCQGSIIQHVFKINNKKKDLLILSNNNSKKGRKNISLSLSDDHGKTWKYKKQVYGGPSAYSCLTILPNGNIGLLYECGEKSPYEGIKYVEIELAN
ncbi:exo-alpha-sialidase [Puteibacter caeruleilacunae]|nr:exo-alpha-sialidase [Puteibacter caeruleilacunae]